MAVRALSVGATVDYVSPRDPCYDKDGMHKPGATVFKLKILDGRTLALLKDAQSNIDLDLSQAASGKVHTRGIQMSVFSLAYDACKIGIAGWENFQDEKGDDVPFDLEKDAVVQGRRFETVVKEDLVKRIDPSDAMAIHRRIMAAQTVDPVIAGN